ncbi:MAG TPA: hypothetical protein VMV05_01440, partial [bacterium]|nr:hypothetical protein [bacterium]
MGRVIPLPGTSLYAGDFPQETEIFESGPTYHTFGGWFAPQVDWGRVGRLGNSPSLLFDGIPAPLSSIRALNWMPVGGSAQFFDFPAEAFWGRESAAGALQITPLGFQDRDRAIGSLWGGSGISGGGSFLYQGSSFSVDGNLRHAVPFGTDGTNTFDLLSRTRWVQSEDFTLEDSLLATQLFPEDYWYAVNTSLKLMSPNFQSVEIRPFYQTSRMSGQDYQEYGSLLNYHFSLAGLAESHIGAGYSRFQTYDSGEWLKKGFIQTTDFGDILGPINLNVA